MPNLHLTCYILLLNTGNIMTVIEIIKEKSDKLSNLIDTSAIEIFHIKS